MCNPEEIRAIALDAVRKARRHKMVFISFLNRGLVSFDEPESSLVDEIVRRTTEALHAAPAKKQTRP